MDRKKKGKNLRKQGGMSQGKADDSLIRCSDEATVCDDVPFFWLAEAGIYGRKERYGRVV